MLKIFISLIVLFFYIYPVDLKFLPFSTDRLLQLIALGYCMVNFHKFKSFIQSKTTFKILVIYFFILISFLLPQLFYSAESDYYLILRGIDFYLYIISGFFCVSLIFNSMKRGHVFIKILDFLVLVAFVQGVISLIFFTNLDLYNSYINLLREDLVFNERTDLIFTRLIGFGSAFFGGVSKFGFILIGMTILPYIHSSFFYKKKVLYIFMYTFLCVVGVMTGRTFFIAIALSLCLAVLISPLKTLISICKFAPIIVMSSTIFLLIGDSVLNVDRIEIVREYVFEMFINYFDSGKLSTSSSDGTLSMYVFPEDVSSWLFGHGRIILSNGTYYMGTDVGYIRLLFYFGLPFTFMYYFFIGVQAKILSNNITELIIKKMIFVMYVFFIILNMKGLHLSYVFFSLFIAAIYYSGSIKKQINSLEIRI